MKLRIDIGTEDAVLTSFMVPILGMLISIFIKNNTTDYKKQNFIRRRNEIYRINEKI